MKYMRLAVILAWSVIVLLTLAGCGGGGGTTPDPGDNNNNNDQVWTGTAATSAIADPGIDGVPTLPFDGIQASRVPSCETNQLVLQGSEFLQQYHGTVDGTNLHMVAPTEVAEGEFAVAWGLYKFTGLLDCNPQWLNIECLPDMFGQEYFVAIPDYTLGDWRWFGPVTFPEFQLDMRDLNHHVISALGNMYFIVVCRAGNGALLSQSTITVEEGGGGDDRLPGAPHNLVATDGEFADKIVIEWEAGMGADSYDLWRKGPDGEWGHYADVETARYEDTEVVPSTHYYYKVFSVNTHGQSGHSNIDEGWAGEGGGTGPATPCCLMATNGEFEDHVALTWNYEGDYDKFEIWRKAPEGDWGTYGETEELLYNDFDVTTGIHYSYKVWAWLGEERGNHSNIDEGWAGDDSGVYPGTPYDLAASDGEYEDHVLLTWEYDGNFGVFEIWRKAPDGDWESYVETQDFTYEDFDVTTGVHYSYKVWAWLNGMRGEHSNIDEGWAGDDSGAYPGTPYDLVATDGEYEDHVALTWEYNGDCDVFEIWRLAPDGEWVSYVEAETNSYDDYDVTPGAHYNYKVWAWIGELRGEHSNIDEGWATGNGLAAPTELWASKGDYADHIEIGWTYEGDYDYFELWRKQDSEGNEWGKLAEIESLTYDDYDMPGDFTFIYKACAVYNDDTSEFSNTDSGYLADPMTQTGSITLTVLDDLEQPLEGISVVLYGNEIPIDAETSDMGAVAFTELPAGQYVVVPISGAYTFEPLALLFEIVPDALDQDAVFVGTLNNAPLNCLCGVAYMFTGDPIEGSRWAPLDNVRMRITLIGTDNFWDVYTDDNGYYEQFDLPEGSYSIIPLLEGYTFSPELHDPVITGETHPGLQNFRGYPAG